MNKIGRRGAMLLLVVPVSVGWSLLIWAHNFPMMLAGRLLIGFAGSFAVAVPQYTSEISEKEIRGILGAISQLFFMMGILFSYSVGVFTNVFWLNVICGFWPLIFCVIFSFIPESPYYLIYKGRNQSGLRSLRFFRGEDFDVLSAAEEIKEDIIKQKALKPNSSGSSGEAENLNEEILENHLEISLREALSRRATKKGILIAFGLMFFFQMSGINVIFFFTKDIFEVRVKNSNLTKKGVRNLFFLI
jgi:MFS family permease